MLIPQLDEQQMVELAKLVQAQASFATAGAFVGLILTALSWGLAIRSANAAKMSETDRAILIGFCSVIALILVTIMVCLICSYGPEIIAPRGEAIIRLFKGR